MAVDSGRIEAAVAEILAAIGEDANRPGLRSTPKRVAEAYAEFFSGVGTDAADALTDSVPSEGLSELVLVRDIEFRSICEHHLLPFLGVAHLAYVPGDRIVGLGRLASVVETVAARPQLQEQLTEQVADALQSGLAPLGVLVVVDAVHGCVTARGARQVGSSTVTMASRGTLVGSSTVTMASRGTLSDPVQRAGVLALIGSPS